MASVQANGITIEYELTGEGDPLLLVMGLGGQLTDWPEGFPEQLAAQGFQVITFDNRDIGLSTEFDWEPPSQAKSVMGMLAKRPPKTGYLLSDMANDAAGLLDALGIESAHVVGMSMGGMIAQTLTIEHPQRVRSLTSIMSNPGDRKSGRIAPKVLSNIVRMKPPTKATAAVRPSNTTVEGGPGLNPATVVSLFFRTAPPRQLPIAHPLLSLHITFIYKVCAASELRTGCCWDPSWDRGCVLMICGLAAPPQVLQVITM